MEKKTWSRRTKALAASGLTAVFLVTGGFALQGHSQAAAYRLQLNNSYQHAFAELAGAVSGLDVALQKGIYATSPALMTALCSEAFGKAMSAQIALGELPYGNIELEQTASFVAKAGDYAMYLSRAAAAPGGFSDEDKATLCALSAGASSLSQLLQSLQSDMNAGAISLEELQAAEARLSQATEDGKAELAGSAYKSIEHEFPETPALIYDGPFSDHLAARTVQMLESLDEVTQHTARAAAAKFMDLKPEIFDLVSERAGQIPAWCFSAAVDGGELYVEVTKAGGLVMEVLNSRAVVDAALTKDAAAARAAAFLAKRGYPNMTECYYIDQGNILTVNFAATLGETILYPDLVKVSIALDNGRVVGFESHGYLMNHKNRDLPAPTVTLARAQAQVADGLHILTHKIALIPTQGEHEVLCHEFKCQDDNDRHCIVYVNALTGQEEKILILLEDESGTLVM